MARLLLKDLTPGTTYKVQVRSKGGDSASEWSRLFSIPTTADSTPPDVPEWAPSDEWVVNGDTFVATWQALDFNLDQNKDFSHYEIKISDGVSNFTIRTTNTSYTLTFEQNRIYFGDAEPELTAQIRSVDQVGNTSAFNALKTATNLAPPAPASIGVTALYDSVKVEWEPVDVSDLSGYKLQVSTTSSSSGFSDVYNGPDVSFIHSTTMFLNDHWYRIYAVDKFGSLSSATTSGPIKPKSTFSVDGESPDDVTDVDATMLFDAETQDSYAEVVWTASPSTDIDRYEIRYTNTLGEWNNVTAPGTETVTYIGGLTPGVDYYFSVRAVDFSGNVSTWVDAITYPITALNDTTAPSQPAAPTSSVGTQKLQVVVSGDKQAGGAMESDVAYYEVFASTATGFTTYDSTTMLGTIQQGPAMVETFNIPATGSGTDTTQTWYVKVRAVDRAGNVSPASNQTTAIIGLIATANIGYAQITDAKIQTLSASKITAGTISAQTINIGSTGVLNIDSTGVIKSNNYVSMSTGYKLDSAGLELNNATISANGLKIRDGRNIMHTDYDSFERVDPYVYAFGKTGGAANNGVEQSPTLVIGGLFGYQHLRNQWTTTTSFPQTLWMTPTLGVYNMTVEASMAYVISGYFWNTGAVNTGVTLGIAWATSANVFISSSVISTVTINAATPSGSAIRVAGSVLAPATAAKGVLFIQSPTLTNGAGYNVDALQVEAVAGGVLTPSAWKASGATTIDGGLIRTAELRSSDNLTINNITLPYWSITTTGSALFSDLLIRGNAVLGAAGEDKQTFDGNGNLILLPSDAGSYLKSYNHSSGAGGRGWAIYSNGLAEFRSIIAGSFDGNGLAEGTVSAEVFKSESVLTGAIEVRGGGIHALGDMGEDIGLSGSGFAVLGPYQVAVTNMVLTSGIATLTTYKPHGFTDPDSPETLDVHNKLYVTGVGAPFDGSWVIESVTSNTVTFVIDGSPTDVSSTPVIGGIVRSKSTLLDRARLIDFPTNGASPNIISGQLNAETLVVSSSASFGGETNLDNGVFTIASGVSKPKSAPTVSTNYLTVPLTGSDFSQSYGITKGHNGNFFVLCKNSTNFFVKEFDSTTGAYVQTVLSRPIAERTTNGTLWRDSAYTIRGIVYHPSHSKYYISYTNVYTAGGGRPIPGYTPTPKRDEVIDTFNTSWTQLDYFSVTMDDGNDAGWVGGSLSRDYTVTNKLIRTIYIGGTLRYSDITLDGSGLCDTASGFTALSGTAGLNAPVFAARVNDIDGVSATRLIVKDRRATGGVSNIVNRWSPFNGTDVVAAEQWEAADNLQVMGGFYDTTEKVIYGLNTNGVVKYESGDAYWSSNTSMTSQRWIGYSWYDNNALATFTVSQREASTTEATLTTSSHGLVDTGVSTTTDIGKWIEVRGVEATFNGFYQITAIPNGTSLRYARVGSAVSPVASGGTVKRGTNETALSPVASHLLKKRSRMALTIKSIPYQSGEYPNQARIYNAQGSTMPTLTGTVSTAWKHRTTVDYPTTALTIDPSSANTGDRPLNTVTNTFAVVNSPSIIQTASGLTFIKGDDLAQFATLKVGTAGRDIRGIYMADFNGTSGSGGTVTVSGFPTMPTSSYQVFVTNRGGTARIFSVSSRSTTSFELTILIDRDEPTDANPLPLPASSAVAISYMIICP